MKITGIFTGYLLVQAPVKCNCLVNSILGKENRDIVF